MRFLTLLFTATLLGGCAITPNPDERTRWSPRALQNLPPDGWILSEALDSERYLNIGDHNLERFSVQSDATMRGLGDLGPWQASRSGDRLRLASAPQVHGEVHAKCDSGLRPARIVIEMYGSSGGVTLDSWAESHGGKGCVIEGDLEAIRERARTASYFLLLRPR